MRALPAASLMLFFVTACGPDQETQQTYAYLDQLKPLLMENSLLAERVLSQAALIHDEKTDQVKVSAAWSEEVVPVARHLQLQAEQVAAPPTWSARHVELVQIWTKRVDAYGDLAEAIRLGDVTLWNSARGQATTAHGNEDEWFVETNTTLGPLGITIDPYP